MDKIKVLHIITRLDPGGSSTNTIETVSRLDRSRYDTFLISGRTVDPDHSIGRSLTDKGVLHAFFPELQREIHPWKDLKAFFQLYAFMRRGRFDIVHTHSSKAGILGRWAAKCAGVKHIVHTPHGHVFYGYFGKIKTMFFIWIERITALITDKIIALTGRGKQEHIDLKIASPDKFATIYSGIDFGIKRSSPAEIEQLRSKLNIPKGSFVFGCAARLDVIKGISYLIDAMPQVLKEFPQSYLLLVGDGQERPDLVSQCERLRVSDYVIFAGFQKDVNSFIECMDVFVLASLNEGMGRVILEAMAAHKHVIATHVGGVPELIEDRVNGILVAPHDAAALATAMITMIKAPVLRQRFADKSKIKITDRFGLDKMVKDVELLYEQCL